MRAERSSATLDPSSADSSPGKFAAGVPESDESDGKSSTEEAAPAPAPTTSLDALALVVRNLSARLGSAAVPPQTLQLAGAARPLWHGLSECELKHRAAATVRLQRTQRGHTARSSTRELLKVRGGRAWQRVALSPAAHPPRLTQHHRPLSRR